MDQFWNLSLWLFGLAADKKKHSYHWLVGKITQTTQTFEKARRPTPTDISEKVCLTEVSIRSLNSIEYTLENERLEPKIANS